MKELSFRPWCRADEPFLWEMLLQSLHVRDGAPPLQRAMLSEPTVAQYLDGFGGRDADDAQICEAADGVPVGAAWCRRMTSADPGYGYVGDDVPELAMAVDAPWRGRGVGRRLLDELLQRHPRMSLSVDDENVGAKALYLSLGFVAVATHGGSTTMLRQLGLPDR